MIKISKDILTQKDFVKKLVEIKKHPELKAKLKEYVPFVNVNGIQTVCPDFQNFISSTDPVSVSLFEGISDDTVLQKEKDDHLGLFFVNVHLFDVFKTIIAEVTQDVMSSKNTWDEYLDCVKRLGFEQVHSFKTKKHEFEQEHLIFWSNSQYMLWYINSYQTNPNDKTVNSSTLYLNGIPKNKDYRNLPYSGGFVHYSNCLEVSFDMRNLPSKKLFDILACIKPVEYWYDAKIYLPDVSELNHLPDYVKNALYSKNLSSTHKEKKVKLPLYEMHHDILNFVEKEITQDDLILIFNFTHLYSLSRQDNVLPLSIIEKMDQVLGISDEYYKGCLASVCCKKYRNLKLGDNRNHESILSDLMAVLKPIELVQYYNEKKKDKYREYFISKEDFDKLEKFVSDFI